MGRRRSYCKRGKRTKLAIAMRNSWRRRKLGIRGSNKTNLEDGDLSYHFQNGGWNNQFHVLSFNRNNLNGVYPLPADRNHSKTVGSSLEMDTLTELRGSEPISWNTPNFDEVSLGIKLEFEEGESEITDMHQLRPCTAFPLEEDWKEVKEEPIEPNGNELTCLAFNAVSANNFRDNWRETEDSKYVLWDSQDSPPAGINADDVKVEVKEISESESITSLFGDSCQRAEVPESRQLILNLIQYFEAEKANGGPFVPISAVYQRVADALKLSQRTVEEHAKVRYPRFPNARRCYKGRRK